MLNRLASSQRILLAGMGGGYDVFAGLPLYFWLRSQGKQVWLANLTFSDLDGVAGVRHGEGWMEVDSGCLDGRDYFPEAFLSRWFRTKKGEEVSLHLFERQGLAQLKSAYSGLCQQLQPDTLLLVDGGTDSLMRGDEAGLGTPSEDTASLLAAAATDVPNKFLSCVGFGIDTFHGVRHVDVLEAIADLTTQNAYLGTFSLLPNQPEFQETVAASHYVFDRMPQAPSIVISSILAGVRGQFGDIHPTSRTEGSELFINPLMGIYWSFELEAVVNRCLYREAIEKTRSWSELVWAIHNFRDSIATKPKRDLPM